MLAYRIPDVEAAAAKETMLARAHPGLARIALAGPWQFSAHPEGGTLATWLGTTVPRISELGEAVACFDGLTYYRPKRLPTLAEVAKPLHCDHEIDVDLANGLRVSIVLATAAPRRLRFTGPDAIGDPVTEYGQLAHRVFSRIGEAPKDRPVTTDDPDVRRLLVLALGQRYRVTEELLDDVGWITTDDADPILLAVFGASGKASAAASGT